MKLIIVAVSTELKRARTESQTDNQSSNWSQSRHRAQQGPQGEQGGTPPAKRLKPNQDTQQQLTNSVPATYTLSSLLNSSPSPNLQRSLPVSAPQTQPPTLSCQNATPASSSPHRPQIHSAPLSHLQARSGGGARWRLRQTLGQRSLARRIQGKERLAVHLRQSLLTDRGEETELLTYQDSTEDLQVSRLKMLLFKRDLLLCFSSGYQQQQHHCGKQCENVGKLKLGLTI